MNRQFNKMVGNPVHRFFDKLKSGGNRLYDKVKTQVINNPNSLHAIGRVGGEIGDYGTKIGRIGAGIATGLGHPEIGVALGASTALSGAIGHAAHLADDRANYIERMKRKEEKNPQQFFA